MARKKTKPTRTQQSILDKKHLGDEPNYPVGHQLSRMDLSTSYNWYNYMKSRDQGYKYLLDYFKERDKKTYNKIKNTPEKNFSQTVYWIARLKSLGYVLPESSDRFMLNSLQYSFEKVDVEDSVSVKKDEDTKPKNVISIQDRMKEKQNDIVGYLEEIVDAHDTEFSLYNYFTANEIAKAYCNHIIEFYKPQLQELEEVLENKDEQLKEAYKIYTKKYIREMRDIISGFISDAERYAQNKKTVRKRKSAPVSIEKKIKNFNFKNEDTELKLVSVNPASIIGASEVWLYNCKYKTIAVLRTHSTSGFDIKGTSILNIDESNSEVKKVGNKAEDVTQTILTSGKRVLKKVLDDIKTKSNVPSQRTTNDVIILRVVQ